MREILIALGAGLLWTSCGIDQKSGSESPPERNYYLVPNDGIHYLYTPEILSLGIECPEAPGEPELDYSQLEQDQYFRHLPRPLKNWLRQSVVEIGSKPAVFGGEINDYIALQKKSANLWEYRSSEYFTRKPKEHMLCNELLGGPGLSQKLVALYSKLYLQYAEDKISQYTTLIKQDYIVNVLPVRKTQFISISENQGNSNISSIAVNNATWNTNIDHADYPGIDLKIRNEINLYPEASDDRTRIYFGQKPLYLNPFTVVHEFGHQVFYHLYTDLVAAELHFQRRHRELISQYADGLISFDKNIQKISRVHLISEKDNAYAVEGNRYLSLSDQSIGQWGRALNEGFADLLAYYVLGADGDFYPKGSCFNVRMPDRSHFNKSRMKVLTKDSLLQLKSYVNDSHLSCPVLSSLDPHIIGSIIAHIFYLYADQAKLNSDQSLRLLLDWVSDLKNHPRLLEINNGADFYAEVMSLLFQQGRDFFGVTVDCQIIQSHIPFMVQEAVEANLCQE